MSLMEEEFITEAESIEKYKKNPNSTINAMQLVRLFPNSKKVAILLANRIPKSHCNLFGLLSNAFLNDVDVVRCALGIVSTLQHCQAIMRLANERFRIDKKSVLLIVDLIGFECIDEKFRDDEEVVKKIISISKNWKELQFVSERLLAREDIIDLAVMNNSTTAKLYTNECAFHYAPKYYRDNRTKVLAVVENNGLMFEFVPAFADDEEVARLAVLNVAYAIRYASLRLRNSVDFIWSIASRSLLFCQFFGEHITDDKDLVAFLLQCIGKHAYFHASKRLMKDADVCYLVLARNSADLYLVPNTFIPRGYLIADVLVCLRLG